MYLKEREVVIKVLREEPLPEGQGGCLQAARARVVLHQPEWCLATQKASAHSLLHRC